MKANETLKLKAFAIAMMLLHHLFGCDTYLTNGEEYEYILLSGDFGSTISWGCKLCIALFTFASGYGLYKSYIENAKYTKIFHTALKFIIQYWAVLFLVAIPYLFFFGHLNKRYIFVNLAAFLHNDEVLYISLSWYVKLYLMFLILCPLIKRLNGVISNICEVFVFIVLPACMRVYLPDCEEEFIGIIPNLLSSIRLLFTWLPVFYLGVSFAKHSVFEKFRSVFGGGWVWLNSIISFLIMTGAVFVRASLDESYAVDMVCTTLFVIGFDYFDIHVIRNNPISDGIFSTIGKYSFQLWLLSGMFYLNTTEFTWLLYKPKISVLIFLWNVILLLPLAVLCQKISMMILKIFYHRSKNVAV